MKTYLLLVFALMGCLLGGCASANKANPFAREPFCNKIFGWPPSALAKCLLIEDDLPLRPSDLPTFDDDEDF